MHFTHHQSPRSAHYNLDYFNSTFDDLTHFLQNMTNIRSLTIDFSIDEKIVDAIRCEQLITSSLAHRKDFRFRFEWKVCQQANTLLQTLEQFQTDFWLKEHH